MPFRTLLLIALFLGLACVGHAASAAAANSPPTADEVEQFIATTLPGYWKVDQLNLSDPVDYGNPIEPEWRWRYEATIVPKEPLYVDGGRHEGVVLLELNLSPESPQTLYGVVIATFHAGSWSGEARHENRPFDHGGQPASFFPGRTVVVGSREERELREATQLRALERLEATHKAESAALKIEQQAAHAEQLASLEADLKAEAQRRRVEITESEKLTELTAEATDRLTALHAEEAEMLAASERLHEARRVALKKLFDMLGVITGPDDYLALLDTASESQLGWMRVAVLRHGLGSDDPASSKAAWRHLVQADVGGNSDLLNLVTDHLATLKDNPDLALPIVKELLPSMSGNPEVLQLVKDTLPSMSGNPEVLQLVKDTLPSMSQWASEVVDFSSQYRSSGEMAAAQVLGEPNAESCSNAGRIWVPKHRNAGSEYIRVRFNKPVWFPEIGVYENNGVGAIRKVILWDKGGQWN